SAYGCRLYCCWCAKDLDANYFWEAMGFVPIAVRAGSRTRGGRRSQVGGRTSEVAQDVSLRPTTHDPQPTPASRARVHIFWQKRIVEGDVETKWWYPSKTDQGAIRADRIVFPIPPGVSWKDVEAVAITDSERP